MPAAGFGGQGSLSASAAGPPGSPSQAGGALGPWLIAQQPPLGAPVATSFDFRADLDPAPGASAVTGPNFPADADPGLAFGGDQGGAPGFTAEPSPGPAFGADPSPGLAFGGSLGSGATPSPFGGDQISAAGFGFGAEASPSPALGGDSESTAAWSLQDEPASGPFTPMAEQSPLPPPVRPAQQSGWTGPEAYEQQANATNGTGPIVPDDWFAAPRAADGATGQPLGNPPAWLDPSVSPQQPEQWSAGPQEPWAGGGGALQPGPWQPDAPQQGANETAVMGGFGPDGGQGGAAGTQQMGQPGGFGPPAPYGQDGFPPQAGQLGPGGPTAFDQQGFDQQGFGQQQYGQQQQFGQGSFGPPAVGLGGPQPEGKGKPNRSLVLAVVGLVVVAVGAVGYVSLSGSGGTPSPDPTTTSASQQQSSDKKGGASPAAKAQAVAINSILDASLHSRGQLNGALGRAAKCKTLPQAVTIMQRVSAQRQHQVAKAKTVKVDKLPQGGQIKAALGKALGDSMAADDAFLRWAQAAQHGCHGKTKPNADKKKGMSLSQTASTDKYRFAKLWDPVATKLGLKKRGATGF